MKLANSGMLQSAEWRKTGGRYTGTMRIDFFCGQIGSAFRLSSAWGILLATSWPDEEDGGSKSAKNPLH